MAFLSPANEGLPIRKIWLMCRYTIILLLSLSCLASCNDMRDVLPPTELPDTGRDEGRMFVLCEGLFNSNNSTLACVDYDARVLYPDFFNEYGRNNRGLGDTANDMQLHEGLLWVVVCVSSQVEVIDARTGRSVRQVPLFAELEDGRRVGRQPRNIAFHGGKAYVCSFDGTVSRIDTGTFEVEAVASCGRNPDGIAVANGKLYVSNSGGLDGSAGLPFDHTVSVVDIATFREVKRIEVGMNPHHIHADSEGDVYVVARGDNAGVKARFQRIDSRTDEVAESFDGLAAVNFVISNDTAYMYNFDYVYETYWVKTFDCKEERVVSGQFVTDGTTFGKPFGIYAHPATGDVFISDAKTYDRNGDLYCFDRSGKLRYKIEEIGLNPNTFLWVER